MTHVGDEPVDARTRVRGVGLAAGWASLSLSHQEGAGRRTHLRRLEMSWAEAMVESVSRLKRSASLRATNWRNTTLEGGANRALVKLDSVSTAPPLGYFSASLQQLVCLSRSLLFTSPPSLLCACSFTKQLSSTRWLLRYPPRGLDLDRASLTRRQVSLHSSLPLTAHMHAHTRTHTHTPSLLYDEPGLRNPFSFLSGTSCLSRGRREGPMTSPPVTIWGDPVGSHLDGRSRRAPGLLTVLNELLLSDSLLVPIQRVRVRRE